MRVGVTTHVAARKACTVVLLVIGTIGMVVPVRDVAIGQSGTGSQPPMYTVKDLHPSGFPNSAATGIADGQQVGLGFTTGVIHALLWRGSAGSVVDLHPSGFAFSQALGTSGGQQVGVGQTAQFATTHALLWSGSAGSVVDLTPVGAGIAGANARGTDGRDQVGDGAGAGIRTHALLWHGSANSFVNLHPRFLDRPFPGGGIDQGVSVAYGISGGQQVGSGGGTPTSNRNHALLWTGSADSAVDLHPSGFDQSRALATSGGQQVGSGVPTNQSSFSTHALLWRGSAGSVVDLNPSGSTSEALGTNGTQQVGWALIGGQTHAVVWRGSANSMVDLHRFLPQRFTTSQATAIDSKGNIAGFASDGTNTHAFFWTPSAVAVIILPGVPSSWTPDAKRIIDGSSLGQVFGVNTLINELKKMMANHLPTTALQPLKQYDTLISTLKAQGIPTFLMPYDWANGGVQAAAQDLDGFIQSVRKQGVDQVDIIAHSAGGLVAQQYIQNHLNTDPHVRNLLMLGTPNQGAVKAHCFIFPSTLCVALTVSPWDFADMSIALLARLARISPATIESLGQLMPTFPYVVDIATTPRQFIPNPRPTPTCGNGCLFDNAYTSRLTAATQGQLNNGTFPAGINVYAERGTDSLTAVTVAVRPRLNPTTVLGVSFASGDKTVLQQSALLTARGVVNIPVPGALHGSSVIDCGASVYLSILNGTSPGCAFAPPPPPGIPMPILIATHSPVKPLLTDPLGRTTGFDFTTGTNVANIPTSILLDGDSPVIFVSQAIRGQYRLELLGVGTGGTFGLDIAYPNAFPNGFDNTVEEISGTIRPGQRLRFVFDALAFQDVINLFAAFQARLEINRASRAFEMTITFTLGPGGTISPTTQPLTIEVGTGLLITIPAGSLRSAGNGKRFVFEGTVNGVALEANLTRTDGNSYSLKIEGAGARGLPDFTPVEVRLAIGNNGGSVSVNAELQ